MRRVISLSKMLKLLSQASERLDLKTANCTAFWVEPEEDFLKCLMLSAAHFIDEDIDFHKVVVCLSSYN